MRRWTPTEDTAVRLADALDYEHGGRRLVELADRLGCTESAVRQRASKLRLERLAGDVIAATCLLVLISPLPLVLLVRSRHEERLRLRRHLCPDCVRYIDERVEVTIGCHLPERTVREEIDDLQRDCKDLTERVGRLTERAAGRDG